MDPALLLLYIGTTLLVCLTPGPNVMMMLAMGLRAGIDAVLAAVAGVVVASTLFLGVSALGLAAALTSSPQAFAWLRAAGAAYLVWLGGRMLVGAMRAPSAPLPASAPSASLRGPFWQGFVTHLSNPKAVLFWAALLPQFMRHDAPAAPQIFLLGGVAILLDAAVLFGYGFVAARGGRSLAGTRFPRALDAAAGGLLLSTGLLLGFALLRV